ncbi:VanZ family protein [Streptomyces sp. NPDC003023]|uniref:VanZ family protein n=1 Tax=Streptomyces sp. NPDC003023 TaxID=3364675 RepID=UPI00368BC379
MDTGARPRREWGRSVLRVCLIVCAFVALVLFSAVLARLTLAPSHASEGVVSANLRPGASLRQYAQDYTFLAACKQVGGNLLLGVPFGVLLPVLMPRSLRLPRVLALTVVVMALVELVQGAIVAGRAFDVDDVILNTTGALIGYVVLGRRLGRAWRGRRGEARPGRPEPETKEPGEREAEEPEPGKAAARSSGWSLSRRRRPVPPRP